MLGTFCVICEVCDGERVIERGVWRVDSVDLCEHDHSMTMRACEARGGLRHAVAETACPRVDCRAVVKCKCVNP